MRIAFGFDIFYPETNGVITTTINLANNLVDLGHEVYFFVPEDKQFTDTVIQNNIHIIRVKALSTPIYKGIKVLPVQSWYLKKYFLKYKFDVIHCTSPWLVCQAMNHCARRMHIPVLATHHTLIDNPIYIKYALKSTALANIAQKPIWPIVFDPFFRLVWMVTAPNKETCKNIKEHLPDLEVRYVSNGIEIERFKKTPSGTPLKEVPEGFIDENTFIYIGRLGYEKAIDVAIKGFAKAIEKNPKLKFLIIGEGPAHKELIELVQDLNLDEKNIYFTGLIDNHRLIDSGVLKKAVAFITASLSENQAITVIEALCSGCPVICANVFNMTALVDKDSGWYFEGGNIDDLAEKILYVSSHREERDQKSANAIKSIDKYDGKKIAKEFESIYLELIEKKKQGFYVVDGEKKAIQYENN